MPMLLLNNNRSGFTLLEVLVALVISMIGMLALLTAATSAISLNLDNILRDEAVQLADSKMRQVKSNKAATSAAIPFQNMSVTTVRMSRLRSKSLPYTIVLSSTSAGESSNLLHVLVSWNYRGITKQHEFSTIKTY